MRSDISLLSCYKYIAESYRVVFKLNNISIFIFNLIKFVIVNRSSNQIYIGNCTLIDQDCDG